MTDLQISQLPAARSYQDTDLFAVAQSGITKKTTMASLQTAALTAPEKLPLTVMSDGNGFVLDSHNHDTDEYIDIMPNINIDFSLGNFAFDLANMNEDCKWGEVNLNIINDVPAGEIRYVVLYSSTRYSGYLSDIYINKEKFDIMNDYAEKDNPDKWRLSYANKIDYFTSEGRFFAYQQSLEDYAFILKFTSLYFTKFIEIIQLQNAHNVITENYM